MIDDQGIPAWIRKAWRLSDGNNFPVFGLANQVQMFGPDLIDELIHGVMEAGFGVSGTV